MEKDTKTNLEIINSYDYLGKSCSFQDCTGLIPAATTDPAELESYQAVYPYLPQTALRPDR